MKKIIKKIFKKIIRNRFIGRFKNLIGVTIVLNMKVKVIEIKGYQLKNILIKLDHISKT